MKTIYPVPVFDRNNLYFGHVLPFGETPMLDPCNLCEDSYNGMRMAGRCDGGDGICVSYIAYRIEMNRRFRHWLRGGRK